MCLKNTPNRYKDVKKCPVHQVVIIKYNYLKSSINYNSNNIVSLLPIKNISLYTSIKQSKETFYTSYTPNFLTLKKIFKKLL